MKTHEGAQIKEKKLIIFVITWVLLSGLLSVTYYEGVVAPHMTDMKSWFDKILNGNANSPYNYRLLIPSLFIFTDNFSPLTQDKNYFATTFMIFLFSTGFLMKALSFSSTNHASITALLYSSFFILLTFTRGGIQPWSYLDIGLYSIAYLSLTRAWGLLIYITILFVSILNRETGILLCALPVLVKIIDNKTKFSFFQYKKELAVLIIGFVFLFGLRFYQGQAEHDVSFKEVLAWNFSPLQLVINFLVYGGALFWLYLGRKISFSSVEIAFLVIILINIILIFFFGVFREIRMFVPYVFLLGIFFSRKIV